jgi:hypothetical protein
VNRRGAGSWRYRTFTKARTGSDGFSNATQLTPFAVNSGQSKFFRFADDDSIAARSICTTVKRFFVRDAQAASLSDV